jgi:hypothetical protein
MSSCPSPLTCGSQGSPAPGTLSGVIGQILAGAGVASALASAAKVIASSLPPGPGTFSLWGITASYAGWFGAGVGAVVAFATVLLFYLARCGSVQSQSACSAGVVQSVTTPFDSVSDQIFPFTAQHSSIDVVVKCGYWGLVETDALYVICNKDSEKSPIMRCYYKTPAVCDAGLGATIGAGVALIPAILAGAAIAAAIGCATIILCILALLLALIVAAVVVLVGAYFGGTAGEVLASPATQPMANDGTEYIAIGDYVSTCGGVITNGDDNGARVYWFVDNTIQHGRSTASGYFKHDDPDQNLNPDACPNCAAAVIQ